MTVAAILKTIEEALIEAGHIGQRTQKIATHQQKADLSIVTSADHEISAMLAEKLEPWLAQPGHVWVDEERLHLIGTPAEVLGGPYEYVWVSDPIDGTAPYANGRSTWGTILGVAKDGQPWLGGISLPQHNKLILTDSQETWLIEGAWDNHTTRTLLKPPKIDFHGHSFLQMDRPDFGKYYNVLEQDIYLDLTESAVYGQVAISLGQAVGYNTKGFWSIWDILGGAAVLQALGMPFINRNTGENFSLDVKNFTSNWKLAGEWIACRSEHRMQLENLLKKAEV
jgi:fructose-1,6-bisphosphatase/inositol monophosphatase family enzyme